MTDNVAVKVIKLVGGMEVIAKVPMDQFTDPTLSGALIVVHNPLYVVAQQQGGQIGFALHPFSFVGNIETVELATTHVLCVLDADERFAQNYLASLAGIVPASAGDVAAEGARAERRGQLVLVD